MIKSSTLIPWLIVPGFVFVAFILICVAIYGWDGSPEIVQLWGSYVRAVNSIPLFGDLLGYLFWIWVPMLPGLLILSIMKYMGVVEDD